MNEQSDPQVDYLIPATPISDTDSNSCNFVIKSEFDSEQIAQSLDHHTSTIDPSSLEVLVKKFAHRSARKETVSRTIPETIPPPPADNASDLPEAEFDRARSIVFPGNECAVLKMRLRTVFEQRERIRELRSHRSKLVDMSRVEAYNKARYGYNLPSKREYIRAKVRWFEAETFEQFEELARAF